VIAIWQALWDNPFTIRTIEPRVGEGEIMNTNQVLAKIAECLGVPVEMVSVESSIDDIVAWDSMGTMNLMLMLNDDFGLRLAPNQAARLQSAKGILALLSEAGKL